MRAIVQEPPGALRLRFAQAFDVLARGLALVLLASLLIECWHDVSQAFDVWYYHVPFAARLAGLLDAHRYAFGPDNQARFEGYPLFAEFLQGLAWRATGHVESTNFVALFALLLVPWYLRRAFSVPLHVSFLSLLAIPLVQIHASSSYVDLPANACVTLLLLVLYRTLAARQPPTMGTLVAAATLAASAANMKFQLVPIVAMASMAFFFTALRTSPHGDKTRLRRLWVFAVAAPVVLATPIKNTVVHGNPVWPVELRIAGTSLPHVEDAYSSSPRHLETSPRPVRFLRSVLELDNRPIATGRRWSIDQFTPTDEPGYRMGGFFGLYAAAQMIALVFFAWRKRSREGWTALALMAAVTAVASFMPQSHELRYYMHWMMLLVSLSLVLWARVAPRIALSAALLALGIVAWSTDATYLYASGKTAHELVQAKTDRALIVAAQPHGQLCVGRPPYTFLYAELFHPGSHHAVQEQKSDADCSKTGSLP